MRVSVGSRCTCCLRRGGVGAAVFVQECPGGSRSTNRPRVEFEPPCQRQQHTHSPQSQLGHPRPLGWSELVLLGSWRTAQGGGSCGHWGGRGPQVTWGGAKDECRAGLAWSQEEDAAAPPWRR